MDLFLTFFGGKPVPPQVDKFTLVAIDVSCRAGSRPLPVQRPLRAVVIAPALVPCPSASTLACRQRPLACHRRCSGSRPLPVSVRTRLPSSLPLPPPTAANAPGRSSPSRRRTSFLFCLVLISCNEVDCCVIGYSHYLFSMLRCDGRHRWESHSNEDRRHRHLPTLRRLPPRGTAGSLGGGGLFNCWGRGEPWYVVTPVLTTTATPSVAWYSGRLPATNDNRPLRSHSRCSRSRS